MRLSSLRQKRLTRGPSLRPIGAEHGLKGVLGIAVASNHQTNHAFRAHPMISFRRAIGEAAPD
jgi:hypothetical protein